MQLPNDPLLSQELVDSKLNKKVLGKKTIKPVEANPTIDQVAKDLANQLNIKIEEMKDWLDLNHLLPKEQLAQLVNLAKHYRLNPTLGHLGYEQDEKEGLQVFITIDGWIAILHQQNDFAGISFNEANEFIDGIPVWMECSIYRTGKSIPITVKEYLCEVRSNHPSWQMIPRRMLRHKTLQEAIRLGFGVSGNIQRTMITKTTNLMIENFSQEKRFDDPKTILKSKLQNLYNEVLK